MLPKACIWPLHCQLCAKLVFVGCGKSVDMFMFMPFFWQLTYCMPVFTSMDFQNVKYAVLRTWPLSGKVCSLLSQTINNDLFTVYITFRHSLDDLQGPNLTLNFKKVPGPQRSSRARTHPYSVLVNYAYCCHKVKKCASCRQKHAYGSFIALRNTFFMVHVIVVRAMVPCLRRCFE